MNKMKKGVAQVPLIILLVAGALGAFGFYAYKKYYAKGGAMVIGDWRMLDITLAVEAPFSRLAITINSQGRLTYLTLGNNNEKVEKVEQLSEEDVLQLEKLVKEVNFRGMEDKLKKEGDPMDLSTYTIVLGGAPKVNGTSERSGAFVHQVTCYAINCPQGFNEIKDKIIKLRGEDINEVGV
jgi:hypothetical protein